MLVLLRLLFTKHDAGDEGGVWGGGGSVNADNENSLARMQLQNAAVANQLSSQKEQLEKQKTPGAPRNQYPMV